MTKVNVYVTGANGFIGKSLINYFDKVQEYNVIGISHSSKNYIDNGTIYSDYRDYKWLRDNVKEESMLIHSAAYIPKKHEHYLSKEVFDINSHIDRFIVDTFNDFVQKIIYISSISVYGNGYKELINITEESQISTFDYYSKSKLFGEELVHNNFHGKEFILRMSSPYGSGKNNISILEKTIIKAIGNENIEIYGKGNRTQDFVYISNICDVIYKFIKFNRCSGVYNLASGSSRTMLELTKIIIDIFKSNSQIIEINRQEAPSVFINNNKICKELNVSFLDLRNGIEKMYNLMKSNGEI